MQKNLYVAEYHLKTTHRVEYHANSENIEALLTSLRPDLFGTIEVKSNGAEGENSIIQAGK